MTSHKIGLLIPCTSKNRDWKNIKESYLYNLTLKTFLLSSDKEHQYKFYIGIDRGDKVFDNLQNQEEIMKFNKAFSNISFDFIYMDDVEKGHLTKMWNILFKKAYDENCDYFFQCGDDMNFVTKNWVNDCINVLKTHHGIGVTGPINNNSRILTQAFVSRRHMEIFGWFFPEEILNWCCDDWYNFVYRPELLFPLNNHFCNNQGGHPRYEIDGNSTFMENGRENIVELRNKTMELAQKHRLLVFNKIKYLSQEH
tara:strand:- start:298 stop:1059 length:762 start_codon:yes stop_codon:yes gene_type:complete